MGAGLYKMGCFPPFYFGLTETPLDRIVPTFQDRDRPEYRYGRESVHDHAEVSDTRAAGAFV